MRPYNPEADRKKKNFPRCHSSNMLELPDVNKNDFFIIICRFPKKKNQKFKTKNVQKAVSLGGRFSNNPGNFFLNGLLENCFLMKRKRKRKRKLWIQCKL